MWKCEEKRDRYRREALAAWASYQTTGLHPFMRSSRGRRSYWLKSTRAPVQTSDLAPKIDAARSALPTLCGDFGLINMIAGVFISEEGSLWAGLPVRRRNSALKFPVSPA